MFFILKAYVYYLSNATNQHGVHSPFVYSFITKCLYKKTGKKYVAQYKKCVDFFMSKKTSIRVKDFGAGSRVFNSNNRSVSKIAKVAGIKKRYALLLMRVIFYFKPKNILEIGTSLGIASNAIKNAAPEAVLTTLEGCENTLNEAKKQFEFFKLQSVITVLGDFNDTLPKVIEDSSYDLILFDGNHTELATIEYFEQCLPTVHNDTVFIFDDIHWDQGMENAWEHIKEHPRVTVTIDLFQWGMVFFRKEQQKEHFTIRY